MAISSTSFDYLRNLVLQRSAIVLEPGKEYLVESRLGSLVRQHGFGSVDDLAAQLGRSPFDTLHRQVVEAMTTNETTFYRDIHPFEALRRTILPELVAARAAERTITIWSAACSSGQEPYTVAMLLREHFPQLRDWTVRFLATDLSTQMLARARAGRYTQLEVNRGLPAPLLVKYFVKDGMEWQLRDEIRGMVEFRELNLAEPWPPLPRVDVVMLRNVLIYFDVAMKRDVLGRVCRVLAPDGYLLLGSAETTMALDDSYQRVQIEKAVAYRRVGVDARRAHVGV